MHITLGPSRSMASQRDFGRSRQIELWDKLRRVGFRSHSTEHSLLWKLWFSKVAIRAWDVVRLYEISVVWQRSSAAMNWLLSADGSQCNVSNGHDFVHSCLTSTGRQIEASTIFYPYWVASVSAGEDEMGNWNACVFFSMRFVST